MSMSLAQREGPRLTHSQSGADASDKPHQKLLRAGRLRQSPGASPEQAWGVDMACTQGPAIGNLGLGDGGLRGPLSPVKGLSPPLSSCPQLPRLGTAPRGPGCVGRVGSGTEQAGKGLEAFGECPPDMMHFDPQSVGFAASFTLCI